MRLKRKKVINLNLNRKKKYVYKRIVRNKFVTPYRNIGLEKENSLLRILFLSFLFRSYNSEVLIRCFLVSAIVTAVISERAGALRARSNDVSRSRKTNNAYVGSPNECNRLTLYGFFKKYLIKYYSRTIRLFFFAVLFISD